jgi:hypothetical protein
MLGCFTSSNVYVEQIRLIQIVHKISTVYIYPFIISERISIQMKILKWQHAYIFFVKSFNSVKERCFYLNINRIILKSTSELNVIVDNGNIYDIFVSY